MNETVDLVLFDIGGVKYATELAQVLRIGSVEDDRSVGQPLGAPAIGKRALVFTATDAKSGNEVEAQLFIDAVLGVHSVSVDDLRRLPVAASNSRLTVGAWVVEGTQTILIVDLHATILSSPRGSA